MWTRITAPDQISTLLPGKIMLQASIEPLHAPGAADVEAYMVKEVRDDLVICTQSGQNFFSLSGLAHQEILNGDWWVWELKSASVPKS